MRFLGLIFIFISMLSCQKKQEVYAPIFQSNTKELKKNSEIEAEKNINKEEYEFIKNWIKSQKVDYYSSQNNYWSSVDLLKHPKRNNGEAIGYQYQLLDLEFQPFYKENIKKENLMIGKFDDLRAIENAVKYLPTKQKAYLICPSIMAFGAIGDGDKILPHQPIIIELEVL